MSKDIPRLSLPEGYRSEPRRCGAKGFYWDCSVFDECCKRHDILYDNAILFTQSPDSFKRRIEYADSVFWQCMEWKIQRVPFATRLWLKAKKALFVQITKAYSRRLTRDVEKAGGVYEFYYG